MKHAVSNTLFTSRSETWAHSSLPDILILENRFKAPAFKGGPDYEFNKSARKFAKDRGSIDCRHGSTGHL